MLKDKENTEPKDLEKQGKGKQGSLFLEEIPVWYDRKGKVCPKWTYRCEEERKQTMNILEEIATLKNLAKAYRAVKKNKGSAGVDGTTVKEFGEWFTNHHKEFIEEILSGKYKPSLVRGVEIPKPNGGKRLLGIPTVKDRVLHQAISQVMVRYYDVTFTESSHGFRPKRGASGALKEAGSHIEGGKTMLVDIDLEKFFDEVNQSRLMWLLSTRIGDRRLLDLIRKILRSGILLGGVENQRIKGTPQGSPLSPLLSNIVLDELDQELTRRGLRFVRYADDLLIFVSSQKSAERVYKGVSEFIRNRMRLKVNEGKSGIRRLNEVNFLGHGFMGKGRLRLSKTSETKFKEKLKKVTSRKRGISLEQLIKEVNAILRGWLNYFKGAKMKSKLEKINSWLKRRIRCFRLKQCKRVIGIVRFLRGLKVTEKLSWTTALSGKSWWRLSNSPGTNIGMNNKWFDKIGYYDLVSNYALLHKSA
jgi:group II intron reverse transcriptase/maturase